MAADLAGLLEADLSGLTGLFEADFAGVAFAGDWLALNTSERLFLLEAGVFGSSLMALDGLLDADLAGVSVFAFLLGLGSFLGDVDDDWPLALGEAL